MGVVQPGQRVKFIWRGLMECTRGPAFIATATGFQVVRTMNESPILGRWYPQETPSRAGVYAYEFLGGGRVRGILYTAGMVVRGAITADLVCDDHGLWKQQNNILELSDNASNIGGKFRVVSLDQGLLVIQTLGQYPSTIRYARTPFEGYPEFGPNGRPSVRTKKW